LTIFDYYTEKIYFLKEKEVPEGLKISDNSE